MNGSDSPGRPFLLRLRPRSLLEGGIAVAGRLRASASRLRLNVERYGHVLRPGDRLVATACWTFPIYSQTFVYEEVSQMIEAGFALRFLYTANEPRGEIPDRFRSLLSHARRTGIAPAQAAHDLAFWQRRLPVRVESLLALLSRESGLSRDQLLRNEHVQLAFSYARLVSAFRPAYLHSYFFYEGTLFTMVAAYLLGVPRGVSCYTDHMLNDFPLKLVPLHLRTADIVVATSYRIRDELHAMHPTHRPGNVVVKPNAVNATEFPQRSHYRDTADPYRLVCVARLEPKKGLLDLVEAVRLVLAAGVRIELDLLGGVDEQAPASRAYARQLEERVRHHGLSGVVRLHGQRGHHDVVRALADADLFVAPFVELESGDKDGIPTALLEAMSTGLPVVSTDAGSIPEPVRHEQSGLVVEQRNPAALAAAILRALGDPDLRRHLGTEGARIVRDRYDVRRCDALLHERIRASIAAKRSGTWR